MKKVLLFLPFCFLLYAFARSAHAIVDPRIVPNNHYGIHIIDENDLEDAADLVNSNGGQWGYVTVLIREDDRDLRKWQKAFDKMRALKLIPIIRLATKPNGSIWEKPEVSDTVLWAEFLNSLVWITRNRYVVIFNEPNHASEWGGKISPEEYAKVLKTFSEQLKSASPDFFILPAGIDSAAPNSAGTLEISNYLARMHKAEPDIFKRIDGWSSHSYPNPDFSASPLKTGKLSIQSFDWEVNYLGQFGVPHNIPIFITETGWVHKEGHIQRVLGYSSDTIADFFKQAFTTVWVDPRIVAITPFVLNYQGGPFDYFSWRKQDSKEFYPQHEVVKNLPKIAGKPEIVINSVIVGNRLPEKLAKDLENQIWITFKNTGESVWSNEEKVTLAVSLDQEQQKFLIPQTAPSGEAVILVKFKSIGTVGQKLLSLQLQKDKILFGERIEKKVFLVVPTEGWVLPQMKFTYVNKEFNKRFSLLEPFN